MLLRLTVIPLCLTALLLIVSVPAALLAAFGANMTLSVTACLGFSVIGKVTPDTVNPAPLITRELIVSGPVPLEVSVTGSVAVVPTFTLPKFRLPGLIASCGLVCPTPMLITRIAILLCLIALLLIRSAPVAVPAALGVDVTLIVTVCLGFSVTGKVAPDTANSPLIACELIVNGPVPVEVTVTGNVAVDPTLTLPKFRLVGLTDSCGIVRDTPVPVRRITVDGVAEELLLMVSVPVIAPVVKAADRTSSVAPCLGFKVRGNFTPDTLNPAPLIVTELIVNGDVPVDVTVNGNVAAAPTVTLPKLRLATLTARSAVPAAAAFGVAENRQQANINTLGR